MAQANVKLTVDATSATRALQGVQTQTNKLQSAFGGLKTAIAGIGITMIARNAVKAATDFEKLNQRLKILTTENGTYSESLKLAEQAQTKFGLSSIDALEGVTNLQARLGPLGSSMDEITAIFNGFNTAAILSGASAQEQAGAMRQLTQALGSGVLRGDEFNSISEQMSAVLKPIADQLGVNVGALRDMAAEGKITKDVVVAAFREIEKQGASALKELIRNDPTMTFKVLSNQTEKLSISVGKILAPAVLDATEALTKLVEATDKFIKSPLGTTVAIFSGLALAAKGLVTIGATLNGVLTVMIAKFKLTAAGSIAFAKASATASVVTKTLAISTGALTVALNALPLIAIVTGLGLLTTAIVKHINKQKEYNRLVKEGGEEEVTAAIKAIEAQKAKLAARLGSNNRIDQSLKRQIDSLNKQLEPLEKQLASTKEIAAKNDKIKKDKEEQKRIQDEINELEEANRQKAEEYEKKEMDKVAAISEFIDSQSDALALLRAQIAGKGEQVALEQRINEAVKIYGEEYRDIITNYLTANAELTKQKENLDKNADAAGKLKEKLKEIGAETREGLVENLREAVKGSQTLGEALCNVLDGLKDKLIDLALDQAISGLGNLFSGGAGGGGGGGIGAFFSGLFGKERGGRVNAGGAFVVGERGPEILQMGSKGGNITPNSKVGKGGGNTTNVVVNVDASGTSVQGNEPDANAFGEQIAAAVKAVIVDEKRVGGLLN